MPLDEVCSPGRRACVAAVDCTRTHHGHLARTFLTHRARTSSQNPKSLQIHFRKSRARCSLFPIAPPPNPKPCMPYSLHPESLIFGFRTIG